MSWSQNGTQITIKMSSDDYDRLLLALGVAIAAVRGENRALSNGFVELANHINEGNPNYTPYEITEHGGFHRTIRSG